jgi:hypothetical protein
MRKAEVRKILESKYNAYRDEVIKIVKGLPPESCLSGDDSGLDDVWGEFKYQVQREESGMFDLYVETIEGLCEDVSKKLPDHEIDLLWLYADAYFDHDDDDGHPGRDELTEAVAHKLYGKVLETAGNNDLTFDPDEERQAAAFQEDLGLFGEPIDEPKP